MYWGIMKSDLNATRIPNAKNVSIPVEPETPPNIALEIPGTPTTTAPNDILQTPAPIFRQAEPFENFHIQSLDGKIIDSTEQIGRPIIIVAWRASCPFCKRYLTMLQDVYEKHSEDFEIWALNFRDSPEVIRQYVAENGLTFLIWPDEKGEVF